MIHSFVFSEGRVVAKDLDLDALRLVLADKGLMVWVDMINPTEEENKKVLEQMFNFHPLAIEDCVMVSHLPKLEDYEDYIFMVMHAVDFSRQDKFTTSELNVFIGKDFLVTYRTSELRFMQVSRDRFANMVGPTMRTPDRLAHAVLDGMLDQYKPVIDELSTELEKLEDRILGTDSSNFIQDTLEMRRELSNLRQIVRPQREVMHRLARGESKLIKPNMIPYFRDLHDALTRTDEVALNYTERLLVGYNVFMNRIANESNEGIKVLAAITTLATPPVLIASWYGMNFEHMPEFSHPYSYPIVIGITVLSVILMALWLRKKKWL
jgi:magnesium transporter